MPQVTGQVTGQGEYKGGESWARLVDDGVREEREREREREMAGSDVEAPAPASLEVVKKANSMDVVASLRNVNDMKVSPRNSSASRGLDFASAPSFSPRSFSMYW